MTRTFSYIAGLTVALSLCVSVAVSYAQNEPFEAAEQVPPNIHLVSAGGYWKQGNDEGFFRVVVVVGGVEHVSYRLFIQWLRTSAEKRSYEIIRTVNVKELNLGHGYVLDVKTGFGDTNAFKIDVTANSRGGKSKAFIITAKVEGKYAIQAR